MEDLKVKDKGLHVVHLGDFQVEVRNSGAGNRYDEMQTTLERALASIRKLIDVDLIVVPGDLIEFADTTTTENDLLQWFLYELSTIAPVVVTLGNHDCAQRAVIIKNHKLVSKPSQVQVTIDTMRNPRVRLLQRSGFYENVFGHTFAVWSHWEKYNKDSDDLLPFSPWEHENAQEYIDRINSGERIIELYHDPISQCRGWDGDVSKTFAEHSTGLHSFQARTILAADIHYPDIIFFDPNLAGQKRLFTYCSSLIMRDFGEGNYYRNGNLYQAGNIKHGYNHLYIDDQGYTTDIEFIQVEQSVGRHTIAIDKNFDYSNIELLSIVPETHNLVRLVVEDSAADFLAHHDDIVVHLKSKFDCQVEQPYFDKNVLMDYSDGLDISDAAKLADEDTINELAVIYIESTIDKTNSIALEDKREAKDMLIGMFKDQLSKHLDKSSRTNKIELESLAISNTLTFGNDVFVSFDAKGISRITGANAAGKTKIFTIIGWMLTDQLHAGQKSNQHRNNRLDAFNYKQPQDWLEDELVFRVNGKRHILKKRIERKWRKNESKWNVPEWRDFIPDTPLLEIEIQSDDFNSTSYDEIMQYLNKIITFEDFYMYVFVNQASLAKLLHMNPDALIANILKIVGLNVFDGLNAKYEEVRGKLLEGLVNPAGTIDAYIQSTSEIREVLETSAELIKEKEDEVETMQQNNNKDSKEMLRLTKEIGAAKRVSEVTTSLEESTKSIDVKKLSIEAIETSKKTETLLHDAIVEIEINGAILAKNTSTKLLETQHTLASKEVTDFDAANQVIANEIVKYKDDKRKALDAISQTKKTTIANNTVEVGKYQAELKVVTDEVGSRKAELVRLHQIKIDNAVSVEAAATRALSVSDLQISAQKSTLESLNNDKTRISANIDTNTKATTCQTCLRALSGDALTAIQNIIETDKKQLQVTSDRILEFETSVGKLNEQRALELTTEINAKNAVKELKDFVIELKLQDCPDLLITATEIAKKMAAVNATNKLLCDEITENDNNFEYVNDEYVTSRQKKIDNSAAEKEKLTKRVSDLKTEIDKIALEIKALNDKLLEKANLAKSIAEKSSNIAIANTELKALNDKKLIIDADMVLAQSAEKKYEEIDLLGTGITNRNLSIKAVNESIQEVQATVTTGESTIELNELSIKQLKKWQLTNSVIRQYKTMLSNTGLQRYIFAKIVDIINNSLNDLLQDIDFRLYFCKDTLQLKMLDLTNNISSSVVLTSGMETSILGLSLLYCTMTLNQIRSFTCVSIDEISGQLNDGSDLSYEAKNNHLLLTKLLRKISKTHSIYIVDHVIKFLGEQRTLEVQKTKTGSVIREIVN